MKTTLNIPDPVFRALKIEAARQGKTMSELVETALRMLLAPAPEPPANLPPLPSFHGGKPLVDISNREALYDFLDSECGS